MEPTVVVILVVISIIVISIHISQRKKKVFEKALKDNDFSPDYIANNQAISLDSKTKRMMLKLKSGYRVYSSEEVLGWGTGYDSITFNNKVNYKYYIEFRVKDLDNPNPRAWFGGFNQERDKWYARVTTLYNG